MLNNVAREQLTFAVRELESSRDVESTKIQTRLGHRTLRRALHCRFLVERCRRLGGQDYPGANTGPSGFHELDDAGMILNDALGHRQAERRLL